MSDSKLGATKRHPIRICVQLSVLKSYKQRQKAREKMWVWKKNKISRFEEVHARVGKRVYGHQGC